MYTDATIKTVLWSGREKYAILFDNRYEIFYINNINFQFILFRNILDYYILKSLFKFISLNNWIKTNWRYSLNFRILEMKVKTSMPFSLKNYKFGCFHKRLSITAPNKFMKSKQKNRDMSEVSRRRPHLKWNGLNFKRYDAHSLSFFKF